MIAYTKYRAGYAAVYRQTLKKGQKRPFFRTSRRPQKRAIFGPFLGSPGGPSRTRPGQASGPGPDPGQVPGPDFRKSAPIDHCLAALVHKCPPKVRGVNLHETKKRVSGPRIHAKKGGFDF